MVFCDRTRHEHIQSIVAAGRIPGGVGGGRKRRDTYFATKDHWSSKSTVVGLRWSASVLVVDDAKKCIEEDVNFGPIPRALSVLSRTSRRFVSSA